MLKFLFLKKEDIPLPKILKDFQKEKRLILIPIEDLPKLSLEELKEIKAILVLGGDGTFLKAVPYAYKYDLPIFGVNMGKFGFLTETYIEELPQTILALERGFNFLEERTLLKVIYQNEEYVGLNEGAVMKGPTGKIIYLNLKINNTKVTTIYGDGLIVSTPTGSTAYNLSAGGPIVHPKAKVFICTPICSFKINIRPLVIPDDHIIEISVNKTEEEIHLLIDGQTNLFIKKEEKVLIKKAEKTLKLIPSLKRDYFQILKDKFQW
ncbi:MAG: NAD(+) kinase [Thermodesulfobacterium geofontis]|uniref:NAD kinase n=2 Tax=Thermodesulfobacterium geofontis TaxID=1295609 RepID=A0A2N7PPD6_9BACT|nr:MAG: NAD(+) kinase [Thermodesulfobacterium geofontis]